MNTIKSSAPSRQAGVSTLLIAMLFLAILTIVAVFAAGVGISEQRTSANDYRYKMAFHVAEGGLAQGIEFLKANTRTILSNAEGGWLFDGDPHWEPCDSDTFTGDVDVCDQLPEDVRAGSYRYVGPDAAGGKGTLPINAPADPTVGGFPYEVQVYASLCRLDLTVPTNPACSHSPSTEGAFSVTVVSVGTLPDENSRAVVRQTFGTYRSFGRAPDAPLIAAGTITALGSATIIPNPNAGGFGVPVSIWAKSSVDIDTADFHSCHLSPWLANFVKAEPDDSLVNGVCANCTCKDLCPETGGLISGNAKACAVAKDKLEGEDILDVDGNKSDASPKLRDSKNFPNDLFAYVFGVPSSKAVDYLTANAKPISNCSTLTAASSGLYWVTGAAAACKLGADVGTLQDPVVIVSDVQVDTTANGQFFGIVFVRSVAGSGDLLKAQGGAQFYGAVILEGSGRLAGSPTIVYNTAVLRNILNSPSFVRYAPIPGTWSDSIVN